jgi:hypothetical protein
VISPLLANIYLHYVHDLWADRWRKRRANGEVIVIRYADDTIVGFRRHADAERFLRADRRRATQRSGAGIAIEVLNPMIQAAKPISKRVGWRDLAPPRPSATPSPCINVPGQPIDGPTSDALTFSRSGGARHRR